MITVINETGVEAPSMDWEAIFLSSEKTLGKKLSPVTVVLIPDAKSKELNARYRGEDIPTNVLSFKEEREILLAPGVARTEASERGIPAQALMRRLVVHGILHLEGYGHDTKEKAEDMEVLERRILDS